MIPSNCFIPCDTFKLFYTMWYLQTVYIMWYLQTVVFHVIHSNCFIPCDACEKKLLVIIISLRGYNQSQFLSLSGTTITVPCYFAMWCIQTVLCHVIPSSWLIPCDAFKLCYAMWYPPTVVYHMVSSNCSYHMIPSTIFV